jgi:hypothetical protein
MSHVVIRRAEEYPDAVKALVKAQLIMSKSASCW